MKAVLIPGDGIGREIAESVRAVSAALNTGIEWRECEAGAEYAEASGELIAPGTLDAIEACGWALKGPTATPIGKGFRSCSERFAMQPAPCARCRAPTRLRTLTSSSCARIPRTCRGISMLTDDIANGVSSSPARPARNLPLCL